MSNAKERRKLARKAELEAAGGTPGKVEQPSVSDTAIKSIIGSTDSPKVKSADAAGEDGAPMSAHEKRKARRAAERAAAAAGGAAPAAVAAPKQEEAAVGDEGDGGEDGANGAKARRLAKRAAKRSAEDMASGPSDGTSAEDASSVVARYLQQVEAGEQAVGERPEPTPTPLAAVRSGTKVFCGGFPYETQESAVEVFFADCGDIVTVQMPRWPDSGKTKGTAFVTFAEPTGAHKAVKMTGQKFKESGRWLKIELSTSTDKGGNVGRTHTMTKPRHSQPPGCRTVFIGNLFWKLEDPASRLKELCAEAELEVINVRPKINEDQQFQGSCHVDFATEDDAKACFTKLYAKMIEGRQLVLDWPDKSMVRPDYSPMNPQSAWMGSGEAKSVHKGKRTKYD